MDGVSRYQVGQTEVICLTDGGKSFAPDVFPTVDALLRASRLADAGLDDIRTSFNCYVLRFSDARVALVDTGCGTAFGPAGGHMRGLLGGLGITPQDVSRIIFTHLHSDHCGGAINGDTLVFPNAQIIVHTDEAAYWTGRDVHAGKLLAAARDIKLVQDGDDLGDGLTAWALPGHTPGHMGVRLRELALVADVVHSEALQLPDPLTGPTYDMDAALAQKSRRLALETVADQGLVWSGCHMLGPEKFARLERCGQGFARVAL